MDSIFLNFCATIAIPDKLPEGQNITIDKLVTQQEDKDMACTIALKKLHCLKLFK